MNNETQIRTLKVRHDGIYSFSASQNKYKCLVITIRFVKIFFSSSSSFSFSSSLEDLITRGHDLSSSNNVHAVMVVLLIV